MLVAGAGAPTAAPASLSNDDIAPTVLAHLGVAWDGEPPDGLVLVADAGPPEPPG